MLCKIISSVLLVNKNTISQCGKIICKFEKNRWYRDYSVVSFLLPVEFSRLVPFIDSLLKELFINKLNLNFKEEEEREYLNFKLFSNDDNRVYSCLVLVGLFLSDNLDRISEITSNKFYKNNGTFLKEKLLDEFRIKE